jgi:threonine/homoserine/homoserine lactone efflux protein
MNSLIGVAGLLVVAAITPGPNNLVVMRAAAHAGLRGALPAMGGVIAGGVVMLVLATTGAGVLFATERHMYELLSVGAAAYLCWLGVILIIHSFDAPGQLQQSRGGPLPAGFVGLFVFQFLNPKSWAMVLTVTRATRRSAAGLSDVLPVMALFVVIPALCLTLWSVLGTYMASGPRRARIGQLMDRVMGGLLIASALALALFNNAPIV